MVRISDDGIIDVEVDEDTYELEPRYHIWKDEQGVVHVEVQDGWSEYVIWDMVKGKLVKTFDSHEVPF